MIAVQDRIPTQPNRKLITPESGAPFYAMVSYADDPTQDGTPINKALFDSISTDITNITINVGSYVGNGAASRTIPTSRTPKFVFVLMNGTQIRGASSGGVPIVTGGLAATGNPAEDAVNTYIEIVSSGFIVTDNWSGPNQSIYAMLNNTGTTYNYIWG